MIASNLLDVWTSTNGEFAKHCFSVSFGTKWNFQIMKKRHQAHKESEMFATFDDTIFSIIWMNKWSPLG